MRNSEQPCFGNVGTIISFRVGVEDAKVLAREFYPTFSETDLVNLPNHSIYLKLLIDGKPSHAFSAVTLAPRENRPSRKHEIIDLSRQSYGRPRSEVERAMSPWASQPAGASDQRRLI